MRRGRQEGRGRVALLGCFAIAALFSVPCFVGLQMLGGLASEVEQRYWAEHKTPVRYALPEGFRGKGEIDFNVPDGVALERNGSEIVFRIPVSGRLRLQNGYAAIPIHIRESATLGGKRIPVQSTYDPPMKGGVGFFRRMNDDANPANGYDDANRWAFFVGTQDEFSRGVKTGWIKPWK